MLIDDEMAQKFFNAVLEELGIPLDSDKATPKQATQMLIIYLFNKWLEFNIVSAAMGGVDQEELFKTIRTYMDLLDIFKMQVVKGE